MPDHHELPAHAANASPERMTALQTARATLSLGAGRNVNEMRTPISRSAGPVSRTQPTAATNVDTVPLRRLTAGRKGLEIVHAGETYLLRVTKANKLILTKPAADDKARADAKG